MKIVLVTFGSRGDVQPILALSLALKRAGHDVLLAGPPEKAEWAGQLGCPYYRFGTDMTAFLDSFKGVYSFRSAMRFVEFLHEEVALQFDALPEIISGADLTIGSSLAFALSSVAESLSIRYRYIAFTPQLFPSGHHPFLALKHHGLPGWYNRWTWRMALILDRFNLTKRINNRRRQLGLRPVKDAWFHILGRDVILACDRVIAGAPPDVKPSVIQTGYMHLNQPDQSNPELEEFLKSGSPPVFGGFGSMPKHDQIECVPIIVHAARSVGRRAVIAKFWDERSEFSGAKDVFFIHKHPHLRLFPSMAAVIHHGGAGTTATASISGVPQIIIPHALDQYYWGHRVYKSRLGPKPIWRSRLTWEKLVKAMKECLSNEQIQKKARNASKMINPLDSLELTVREILRNE
jgi:UDP:flavonoid glycosyltransferase YjiC (YdhE family)